MEYFQTSGVATDSIPNNSKSKIEIKSLVMEPRRKKPKNDFTVSFFISKPDQPLVDDFACIPAVCQSAEATQKPQSCRKALQSLWEMHVPHSLSLRHPGEM